MTRKRKHPDTRRLDWLEQNHAQYDPFKTIYGYNGIYFDGQLLGKWETFRKAIVTAMRHQRQNGGKS